MNSGLVTVLFGYHKNKMLRYFEANCFAKGLTAFLFVLVFGWVAVGIFFFFKRGFRYLEGILADEVLSQQVVPLFVYESFWVVLMYLIIFSALITGFFQMFRRFRDDWVVATPSFSIMPWYTFLRVFLLSLWPVLVLGVPALWAIETQFQLPCFAIVVSFFALVLLVAFCVCLTQIFLLFWGKLMSYQRCISLKKSMILGIVLFFVLSLVPLSHIFSMDLAQFFGSNDATKYQLIQQTLISHFQYFPSHYAVMTLFAFQLGKATVALQFFGLLLGGCFLLWGILWLVSRFYLSLWQFFGEGVGKIKPKKLKSSAPFPRFFSSPLGAFFEKEALTNIRNPQNFLWFLFLTTLWLFQVGAGLFLSANMEKHGFEADRIITVSLVLQFVTTVFFMSAFVLRFAFPSFSLEGRSAWILAHSPLDRAKIFWSKFFFYTIVFVFLGIGAGIVNFSILNLPLEQLFFPLVSLGVGITFMTGLGLSLGSLFPNFESDDPQVITTSLSGLFFTFGVFLYGALGAMVLYWFLQGTCIYDLPVFLITSILVLGWLLWFTQKKVKRMEFV